MHNVPDDGDAPGGEWFIAHSRCPLARSRSIFSLFAAY